MQVDFRRRPAAERLLRHAWFSDGYPPGPTCGPTPHSSSTIASKLRAFARLSKFKRAALLAAARNLGSYEHEDLVAHWYPLPCLYLFFGGGGFWAPFIKYSQKKGRPYYNMVTGLLRGAAADLPQGRCAEQRRSPIERAHGISDIRTGLADFWAPMGCRRGSRARRRVQRHHCLHRVLGRHHGPQH